MECGKSVAVLYVDPGLKLVGKAGLLFVMFLVLFGVGLEVEDVHLHFMYFILEGGKMEKGGLVLFLEDGEVEVGA